jgi:hypothetical protein
MSQAWATATIVFMITRPRDLNNVQLNARLMQTAGRPEKVPAIKKIRNVG